MRSYCSRHCQSMDWRVHQFVCPYHDKGHLALHSRTPTQCHVLDTLCDATQLHELDLTESFTLSGADLHRLSVRCRALSVLKLNGCAVDDEGVRALSSNLYAISVLQLRASRYLTDAALECVGARHAQSLREIDVSRCCLVRRGAVHWLLRRCVGLEVVSIACGIKRGGWIWGLDDALAHCILTLRRLRRVEYLYADDGSLSSAVEHSLWNVKALQIMRLSTDKRSEIASVEGRARNVRVDVVRDSEQENPVLMQHIQGGRVTYEQRFRR